MHLEVFYVIWVDCLNVTRVGHPDFYASPSSEDTYSDWHLNPNFELWVEIFCVPTCFHMRIPKLCLSVRTSRKEIRLIHQWKGFHEYYNMETEKFEFLFKKGRNWILLVFWVVLNSWNHLSFVNISPTLVNDTSMERSSRVLYHEKSKIWFY